MNYKNHLILSDNKELISKNLTNIKIGSWIDSSYTKDFATLKYHWSNKKKLHQDIRYIKKVYKFYIRNFSNNLNKHFKIDYSERNWEILIGYWLNLFISFYFDRWEQVNSLKKKKLISNFFYFEKELFIPKDTLNFSIRHSNNDWNHWVFYEILKFQKFNLRLIKSKSPQLDYIVFPKKTNYSFKIFNQLFKEIIRKKKICMYDLDLPRSIKFKIDFDLDKFSTIFFLEIYKSKKVNISKRKKFFKSFKYFDNFTKFLIDQIPFNFPKSFFEDYDAIRKSLKNSFLPVNPRIILTSTSHLMNDQFKSYIALKVPKSKFFVFQHGGSYHTQGSKLTDLIEFRTCDKFLTWGWREKKNKKLIPMFNPKNLNHIYHRKTQEEILIPINSNFPSSPGYVHGLPRVNDETKKYFQNIQSFVNNLSPQLKKIITIKISNTVDDKNSKKNNFVIFKNKNRNNVKFLHSNKTTSFYTKNSTVIVEFSNTTGFLEMINLNFPTILIFDKSIEKITPKTKKFFEKLKQSKVLFSSPTLASQFLNNNFYDINKWWKSEKVQRNVSLFRNHFSRKEKNPLKKINHFLKNYA